jgi:(p)ppGpp synthase/HD superfamily hydrolase
MLGQRFDDAFQYAARLHRLQTRKESPVPYIAHLMTVGALVLENGGDEDQAIAALLHDGPEDQGGELVLQEIRSRFGADVAMLVAACGEPLELGKREWYARKNGFLAHIRSIPQRAVLIVAADKVHNARSILQDHAIVGGAIFRRFNGGEAGTKWYYQQLAATLHPIAPRALGDELAALAGRIALL